MKFNTKTIHGNQKPDKAFGSVMPPIYHSTTYSQSAPNEHKGYAYSRSKNPTRSLLEGSIASLENGAHGIVFSSGMAAIDAVLKLLSPGDEVITTFDIYGGTYRIFKHLFEKYQIKFHFIEFNNKELLTQYLSPNTRLIWIESPSNPLLNILDIQSIATIARKYKLLLCVDNTFATPYLQNPLDLGADIVMHSLTKYLGGHSDIVMGGLIVKDSDLAQQLYFIQNASGAISSPNDCFLALRGIKTLHVRMQRHCENAEKIANYLNTHSKVKKTYWPGLSTHHNHLIAKKQMKHYGGMIAFFTKDDTQESAFIILKKLKIFTLAESLGGVESLAGHPATMTHGSLPKKDREKLGITDSLIRLSVGIEDVEDLIADLDQALQ